MGKPGGPELDSQIKGHYESGVETDRLLKGTSRLEFERTKRIMVRFLPREPSTILDIGGGPGFYARWLSSVGHTVHLVDPVPLHIRQARGLEKKSASPIASIKLGDARRLGFQDESADAVLMLGPLYHLVEERQRLAALREARRVLKPGGRLFAAAISRFASALDGSFRGFIRDPAFMKIVLRDLRNGQHRNPGNHPEYFTTAFFHHPRELEAEIQLAEFKSVRVFAVDSFGSVMPDFDKFWANAQLRARLLNILEKIETEPSMLGVRAHLLGIGQKKWAHPSPG